VKDLVPVDEFASSLGRSVRSIYDSRYRGSDLPPAITIGRRLYFVQADVDEWIGEKRGRAKAEMTERQRAMTVSVGLTRPSSKNRNEKSREPRAFDDDRDSLETALSKGLSCDQ
jgi:predicted DNA-binding transcriptional regulator AlpA